MKRAEREAAVAKYNASVRTGTRKVRMGLNWAAGTPRYVEIPEAEARKIERKGSLVASLRAEKRRLEEQLEAKTAELEKVWRETIGGDGSGSDLDPSGVRATLLDQAAWDAEQAGFLTHEIIDAQGRKVRVTIPGGGR